MLGGGERRGRVLRRLRAPGDGDPRRQGARRREPHPRGRRRPVPGLAVLHLLQGQGRGGDDERARLHRHDRGQPRVRRRARGAALLRGFGRVPDPDVERRRLGRAPAGGRDPEVHRDRGRRRAHRTHRPDAPEHGRAGEPGAERDLHRSVRRRAAGGRCPDRGRGDQDRRAQPFGLRGRQAGGREHDRRRRDRGRALQHAPVEHRRERRGPLSDGRERRRDRAGLRLRQVPGRAERHLRRRRGGHGQLGRSADRGRGGGRGRADRASA